VRLVSTGLNRGLQRHFGAVQHIVAVVGGGSLRDSRTDGHLNLIPVCGEVCGSNTDP
jgi:hypothetical protein